MDRTWALAFAVAAATTVGMLPNVPAQAAVGLGLVAAATTKAGVWLVRHERAARRIRTRAT